MAALCFIYLLFLCVCVCILTVAGTFVRAQFHEVRTGTGERLVVVDETQVRTGIFAVFSCTWVWSCGDVRRE